MKKLMVFVGLCLLMVMPVVANTREDVKFSKCTDGDTAHVKIGNKNKTVRFLAIDSPEYTKEIEPYGKEASEYTCNALEKADVIELEYDDGSDKEDKYGRLLAWVYVDGELLQKKLVAEGLAEVAYLYDDYAHTNELKDAEKIAQKEQKNIWSGKEPEAESSLTTYILLGIGFLLILALSALNVRGKNAKIRRIQKAMRKVKK